MKCYYVLIHGKLKWHEPPPPAEDGAEVSQPIGFYCHRYVRASTPQEAEGKAFDRVRRNLDRDGWLTKSAVTLTLEADEIVQAPIYKLLIPENRGHAFYREE